MSGGGTVVHVSIRVMGLELLTLVVGTDDEGDDEAGSTSTSFEL